MSDLLFFVGLHQPADTAHFDRSFVSVNRLRARKSAFPVRSWIMDSGAFTEIHKYGCYRESVHEYAAQIDRWRAVGDFRAAAIQDMMCEPFILKKTGLTVRDHQRITIERFDQLRDLTTAPLLIVLQGYQPEEYVQHIDDYGARLRNGAWVGVGSICKRNSNVPAVEDVLTAIKRHRRDLRLHGFGLKITAIASGTVRESLATADSMAWSYAARKAGRNANDWREAKAYEAQVMAIINEPVACQGMMDFGREAA